MHKNIIESGLFWKFGAIKSGNLQHHKLTPSEPINTLFAAISAADKVANKVANKVVNKVESIIIK